MVVVVVAATVLVRGEGLGGGTVSGGAAPCAWLATLSRATPGVMGLGSGRGGEAPPCTGWAMSVSGSGEAVRALFRDGAVSSLCVASSWRSSSSSESENSSSL